MLSRLAGLATAVTLLTSLLWNAPAGAEERRVRANLAGAFPSSMGILGSAQARVIRLTREMSAGLIDLRYHEPGALMPGSQYFDAVANGTLDMAFTASGYFAGKDAALALFTSVPFGPGPGEYLAWFDHGGGNELMREILEPHNVVPINCSLLAPEAAGWFRNEIKTLDDLKGLRMRILGLGANVMRKFGVITVQLRSGEIFQALQLGTIDATEFSLPTLDMALGFYQEAKYYYFPGWHQQASIGQLFIAKAKWAEFSDAQKSIIITACKANMLDELSEAEALQFGAMQDLIAKGVVIKRWSPEFLQAFEGAWTEVAEEEAARSASFARVWASYSKFRAGYAIWRVNGYLGGGTH